MKKEEFKNEMDIEMLPSGSALGHRQKGVKNSLEKEALLDHSSPFAKVLIGMLTESVQDQYRILSKKYQDQVGFVRALGGRAQGQRRFLSDVQRLLGLQGFCLDRDVLKMCLDRKLCSSVSKV